MSDKFWFNGIPYDGLPKTGIDTGSQKYWFNGIPVDTLTATSGSTTLVSAVQPWPSIGRKIEVIGAD